MSGIVGAIFALSLAAAPSPMSFGALEVSTGAAGGTARRTLSLDEVLASVVDRHPMMVAAARKVDAAEGSAMAARGHFDLKWRTGAYLRPLGYYVNGRLDTQVAQATPFWGTRLIAGYSLGRGTFPDYYGEKATLSAGEVRAGLVVPLWRDGPIDKGRAGIQRADIDRDISLLDRDKETIKLIKATTQHYWEWVAAGLRRSLAEEQLGLASARDLQVRSRAERGEIPPVEAIDNRRALLKRQTTAVKARQELEQAAISLRLFVRDAEGVPVDVSEAMLPDSLPLGDSSLTDEVEALVQAALERRPELRSILLKRSQAELDRRLAKNQRAPAIDVGAMVLRDFGRGPEYLAPTELQVSLVVEIPLQAREARGKMRKAEAEAAGLSARADLLRDTIAVEVERAMVAVIGAHERAEVAGEAVSVARELASAERRRFDLGATTLLFVNIREQQVADAALEEIEARLAYQKALAELGATTASALGTLEAADPSSAED